MLNFKFCLPNGDLVSTGSIDTVTTTKKNNSVVIKISDGYPIWLEFPDKDTAVRVRDEINKVTLAAQDGTKLIPNWDFIKSAAKDKS